VRRENTKLSSVLMGSALLLLRRVMRLTGAQHDGKTLLYIWLAMMFACLIHKVVFASLR
jgi:hypothetical protein